MFIDGPNGFKSVFKSDGKVPLALYPAGTESICDGSPVAERTVLYTENGANIIGATGGATPGSASAAG